MSETRPATPADIIDALRQAEQILKERNDEIARLKQGWQPIKTAPKNGEDVLCWVPRFIKRGRPGVAVLCFDEDLGWTDFQPGCGRGCYGPTHWMPLPAQPTDKKSAASTR